MIKKLTISLLFLELLLSIVTSSAAEPKLPKMIDFRKVNPCCENTDPNLYKLGALGFNQAPELSSIICYLKKVYNLDIAVETGTFKGNTTTALSYIFDTVYTVEINDYYHKCAQESLNHLKHVEILKGSSEAVLKTLLPTIKHNRPLFYLDAHWEENWPLREEIIAIGKTHKDNCVIIIDDAQVPNNLDIPCDAYKGQALSYEYIKDVLPHAFTYYTVHYIIPKDIHCRGKLLILPVAP